MPHTLLGAIGALTMILTCGLSAWVGDRDQRIAALSYLTDGWLSMFLQGAPASQAMRVPIFCIDLVELAILVWIALTTRERWASLAAAFALLGAATHLSYIVDPRLHPWAYIVVMNLCGYGVEVTLVVASLNFWRTHK